MPTGNNLEHEVITALGALQNLLKEPKESVNHEELARQCDIVARECSKGLSERVLATEKKGYDILINCARTFEEIIVRAAAVRALASLMDGNPDPLEEEGFKVP